MSRQDGGASRFKEHGPPRGFQRLLFGASKYIYLSVKGQPLRQIVCVWDLAYSQSDHI